MFEERRDAGERSAAAANVRAADTGAGDPRADAVAPAGAVPVPEPLAGLLPGGLHRGEAAALATRHREQHPDYLALALLAGALNAGLWCAVVGVPDLGLAALAGMLGPTLPADPVPGSAAARAAQRQAALDRLLLVPDPGAQWAEALTVLAGGVDLLLVRPLTPISTEIAGHVDARLLPSPSPSSARHKATRGSALLVLGGWPSARLSLHIARADWTGLDGIGPTAGTGRLTGCRATVVAQGWATAGRPRAARLWLPDANGAVRSLSDDPRTAPTRSPSTAA
jgi:hypothetical protein